MARGGPAQYEAGGFNVLADWCFVGLYHIKMNVVNNKKDSVEMTEVDIFRIIL